MNRESRRRQKKRKKYTIRSVKLFVRGALYIRYIVCERAAHGSGYSNFELFFFRFSLFFSFAVPLDFCINTTVILMNSGGGGCGGGGVCV